LEVLMPPSAAGLPVLEVLELPVVIAGLSFRMSGLPPLLQRGACGDACGVVERGVERGVELPVRALATAAQGEREW
jgi:hypothetical protein